MINYQRLIIYALTVGLCPELIPVPVCVGYGRTSRAALLNPAKFLSRLRFSGELRHRQLRSRPCRRCQEGRSLRRLPMQPQYTLLLWLLLTCLFPVRSRDNFKVL